MERLLKPISSLAGAQPMFFSGNPLMSLRSPVGLVCIWLSITLASPVPAADRSDSMKRRTAKPQTIRLPKSSREEPGKLFPVAAVRPEGRRDAKLAGGAIDSMVQRPIYDAGDRPNPRCDDETFLRRVYLDVAGRIPTLAEVNAFLDSKAADKRLDLIDELLSSPDYVSNFYNLWADTLRLHEQPVGNVIGTPYLTYVRDSLAENKPYDEWVHEMLTADGKAWENPAVGYQLRDEGMPLPYVDNTVRIFLGTQIGCAQCHDHPFDSWTQYQFYQLAAFTTGTTTRHRPASEMMAASKDKSKRKPRNVAQSFIREAQSKFPKGRVPGEFQRLVRANDYSVSERAARLRLPHDYAYEDAKPKEIVEPEVLWGEIPNDSESATGREKFAAWVTSRENDRFAKTVANRLWKRVMGLGLVEPIDDFRDENPPSNPELMKLLADQVREADFDLKQFVRGILYSDTYQSQSEDYEVTSGESFDFRGPVVRRMTAEQVWDSMLTLAVRNTVPFTRPEASEFAKVMDLDLFKANYDQILARSEQYGETLFPRAYNKKLREYAYQGNVLCRASELPTPLPGDHFLRQFGQGDREVIDGSDDAATVPQILAMFNGPITHVMLEPGSRIVEDVLAIETPRERVEAIFKAVLSRPPSASDRRVAAVELSRSKSEAVSYGNIIWALLNTREFLFVR